MADESKQGEASHPDTSSHKSAMENIRELRDASKELVQAGEQITENLGESSDRVEHAKKLGTRVVSSPWLLAGVAMAIGLFVLKYARSK